jgi:hypothetical protein
MHEDLRSSVRLVAENRGALVLGILLGVGGGIWSDELTAVLEHESDVLLAMAGASVGLLAVALAVMALLTGFLRDYFGKVIATIGMSKFFAPFQTLAVLSAMATVVSFAGAMGSTSGPVPLRGALFGSAIWLFSWSIVEAVHLIWVFVRYATQEQQLAEYMTSNDRT